MHCAASCPVAALAGSAECVEQSTATVETRRSVGEDNRRDAHLSNINSCIHYLGLFRAPHTQQLSDGDKQRTEEGVEKLQKFNYSETVGEEATGTLLHRVQVMLFLDIVLVVLETDQLEVDDKTVL